jgi:TetR/AcrR family transcriptional regulator, mexCD-oprJ operon repressor
MAQLAVAIGVSRATLYRHVRSREALFSALRAQAVEDARQLLDEANLERVDVPEAIARIARALVAVGNRYAFLVERYAQPRPSQISISDPIVATIERGQADGTLRDDVPADWLMDSLLRLLSAGVIVDSLRELGPEEVAANAVRLFLDGARARPG